MQFAWCTHVCKLFSSYHNNKTNNYTYIFFYYKPQRIISGVSLISVTNPNFFSKKEKKFYKPEKSFQISLNERHCSINYVMTAVHYPHE